VLLLGNPRARSGEKTPDLVGPLEALGIEVLLEMPSGIDRLHEVIRRVGPSVDRIVIAGGDGSIAPALPALLEVGKPLAVIPLGTANDLARNLELPASREEQLALVANGPLRTIDLGSVNGRPFLNAASIGLGAAVASLHQGDAKRWLGVLNYLRVLYLAWRRIRPFTVDITCDGVRHHGRFVHVAVLNGRFHGGGLEPRPDGAIDDGQLDLYALRDGPMFRLMRVLAALRIRGMASEALYRLAGTKITIRTKRPRRVNVDGELCMETPLTLEIMPRALCVVAPSEEAEAGSAGTIEAVEAATP
jgi:diacylglycerol kinase (ATP)